MKFGAFSCVFQRGEQDVATTPRVNLTNFKQQRDFWLNIRSVPFECDNL